MCKATLALYVSQIHVTGLYISEIYIFKTGSVRTFAVNKINIQ